MNGFEEEKYQSYCFLVKCEVCQVDEIMESSDYEKELAAGNARYAFLVNHKCTFGKRKMSDISAELTSKPSNADNK